MKNTRFTKKHEITNTWQICQITKNWCCTYELAGVWWTLYIYLFVSDQMVHRTHTQCWRGYTIL